MVFEDPESVYRKNGGFWDGNLRKSYPYFFEILEPEVEISEQSGAVQGSRFPPRFWGESLFWGGGKSPPAEANLGGKLSPPEVDFFEIFGKKILIFVNVFQKFRLRRIFCAFGAIEMEERRDIFHVKNE